MVDVVIVQQRMNDIASPLIISLFKDCSCLHHFGGELSESEVFSTKRKHAAYKCI